MACATSACLPASIEPAGPPTSGNPTVETTASTTHASGLRESISTTPSERRACSCSVVSKSRTTVCASTPLMKMGTGLTPDASSAPTVASAGSGVNPKGDTDGSRASYQRR